MERDQYDAIVRRIGELRHPLTTGELQTTFPGVDSLTLGGILGQERQRLTKRTVHRHSKPDAVRRLYTRFTASLSVGEPLGALLRLAESVQLAPALLAKFVLNCHLDQTDEAYQLLAGEQERRQRLNALLRSPLQLADCRVAAEVRLCLVADNCYGPPAEAIKRSIGVEFEARLLRRLDQLAVPYLDETELRRRGYDKTPDALLDVPVAVAGCIVNWIESKASFGDVESHRGYMDEQYVKYWRRFGPGLVIYWFGFLEELIAEASEKHVLLRDSFPEDVVFMNPELGLTMPSLATSTVAPLVSSSPRPDQWRPPLGASPQLARKPPNSAAVVELPESPIAAAPVCVRRSLHRDLKLLPTPPAGLATLTGDDDDADDVISLNSSRISHDRTLDSDDFDRTGGRTSNDVSASHE